LKSPAGRALAHQKSFAITQGGASPTLRSVIPALSRNPETQQRIPALYVFSRNITFSTIPKACGFEAATRFTSIQLCGGLIPIVFCGEAVPALFSIRGRDALATLRPAGILPASENKGKMPSPHGDGFPRLNTYPAKAGIHLNRYVPGSLLSGLLQKTRLLRRCSQ